MAKVLEQSNVIIVGSECPDLVADCKMIPAATMEEALALAASKLGPACDVLIVPHAMLTLPVLQTEVTLNETADESVTSPKTTLFRTNSSGRTGPRSCWPGPDSGPARVGFHVRQRHPLFHRQ
jgi:hypothetical protein